MPSSRGSSQSRDRTQVSHIAGRFFTVWATREAKNTGVGVLSLLQGNIPDPGIKPGSPALQADSSPAELLGKSSCSLPWYIIHLDLETWNHFYNLVITVIIISSSYWVLSRSGIVLRSLYILANYGILFKLWISFYFNLHFIDDLAEE